MTGLAMQPIAGLARDQMKRILRCGCTPKPFQRVQAKSDASAKFSAKFRANRAQGKKVTSPLTSRSI
jgi:hypothetical protein